MTLFYYDPIFQEHWTGNHPEHPERLLRVIRHLQWTGMDSCCQRPAWGPVTAERLGRVHRPEYARSVEHFCASTWVALKTTRSLGAAATTWRCEPQARFAMPPSAWSEEKTVVHFASCGPPGIMPCPIQRWDSAYSTT